MITLYLPKAHVFDTPKKNNYRDSKVDSDEYVNLKS